RPEGRELPLTLKLHKLAALPFGLLAGLELGLSKIGNLGEELFAVGGQAKIDESVSARHFLFQYAFEDLPIPKARCLPDASPKGIMVRDHRDRMSGQWSKKQQVEDELHEKILGHPGRWKK